MSKQKTALANFPYRSNISKLAASLFLTRDAMTVNIKHSDNQILLSWQLSPVDISPVWFEPGYWQRQQKIYAEKKGRATTWFFHHGLTKGVLRHYWRGGLIGKLLQDQYLYTGLKNTRVYREFSLLTEMHQKGLNVPLPIAASVIQQGLIYRGDIITGAIAGAQSLLDILQQRRLAPDEITRVADTIAEFHRHGVYHADLNINNILFGEDRQVYLIDFDRGEFKTPNPRWQQANMARLQRSFNKELGRNKVFHWQANDWDLLLKCYREQ